MPIIAQLSTTGCRVVDPFPMHIISWSLTTLQLRVSGRHTLICEQTMDTTIRL